MGGVLFCNEKSAGGRILDVDGRADGAEADVGPDDLTAGVSAA